MKKELLLLDCFGVIADAVTVPTLEDFYSDAKKAKAIWDKYGPEADIGNLTMEESFDAILHEYGGDKKTFQKIFASHCHIRPEMKEFLQQNHDRYDFVLVSNAPKGFVEKLFFEAGIAEDFKEIVVSSAIHMVKPNADIFEYALSKIHPSDYSKITFIDDNDFNFEGVKNLPIETYLFTSIQEFLERFAS